MRRGHRDSVPAAAAGQVIPAGSGIAGPDPQVRAGGSAVFRASETVCFFPRQGAATIRILHLSTDISDEISTGYPQENVRQRRIFLAEQRGICDSFVIATVLRNLSGTQGPRRPERFAAVLRNCLDRKGFPETVRSRRFLGNATNGRFQPGRSGLQTVFGPDVAAKVLRNRSNWFVRPFGVDRVSKASGCAFGHDARTASEHLAPFPISDPPQ